MWMAGQERPEAPEAAPDCRCLRKALTTMHDTRHPVSHGAAEDGGQIGVLELAIASLLRCIRVRGTTRRNSEQCPLYGRERDRKG